MKDKEILSNIAHMLRIHYPDAVSVTFSVTYQEYQIDINYRNKLEGESMKSLNGEWIKEETAC